ncbi:hypothetical protein [Jiulongibacter sp. NS-SX5]|uniref:hypothetical protein n=1 Tax=Jiulongibacter sp. NS-SX5 TaxID=3463854 RepID=UPI004058F0DE
MLKAKLAAFYFLFKIATCSCKSDQDSGFENLKQVAQIEKLGTLAPEVNESSGLAYIGQNRYLTHNDSGGKPAIYTIDSSGQLINTITLKNCRNIDWEDITTDDQGNIYIGDFGNNLQKRADLQIIKVLPSGETETLSFEFADQQNASPEDLNFDCEAMFWHQGNLHLFSKSRNKDSKVSKHYSLPDRKGHYSLKPIEGVALHEMVTAADISPDGHLFALLTYGKILLFEIKNDEVNYDYPVGCLKTGRKQTEAIAFKSANQIVFSNEQRGLYQVEIALP